MLSPAIGYAAAAMGYLASCPRTPLRAKDIAKAIGAPPAYLAKIVHALARKGYFRTRRGRGGGVILGTDPSQVTLYELCVAMNDDVIHLKCGLGHATCSLDRACPAHEAQQSIRRIQLEFLRNTTITQVGEFVGCGAAGEACRHPMREASGLSVGLTG